MIMFKILINPKTYLLVLGLAAPGTAAPATASAASTAPTAATGAKTSAKTSSTTGVVRHLLHDKKTTKTFSYLSSKIRTCLPKFSLTRHEYRRHIHTSKLQIFPSVFKFAVK